MSSLRLVAALAAMVVLGACASGGASTSATSSTAAASGAPVAGAIDAAKSGVNAVHVVDGRVPHAMLLEVLTDQAYGTMIRSH